MTRRLERGFTRREMLGASAAAFAGAALGSCSEPAGQGGGDGRLQLTPGPPSASLGAGIHPLGLGSGRDGRLHVPASYDPQAAAPLVLLLHGATGSGTSIGTAFEPVVELSGAVTLSPDSRGSTWDAIRGGFGPDVAFIGAALRAAFDRVHLDPTRLAIAGFSDGASYALSLGLTNGDLFRRVLAFSPGFMAPGTARGRPEIFISHGTDDDILPIAQTSRRIVPALQRAGYSVDYREYAGGHAMSRVLVEEAMQWAAAP